MNTTRKFTKTNYLHLLILLAAVAVMAAMSVPEGKLYGSTTDWFSQHVTIADYMRKQFYATGNLIPDYSSLGGGGNFYSLSYYGFLRPDILISYFLPHIPVETVIQGYAVLGIMLGAGFLYFWLWKKGIYGPACLAAGFLYICADCLFQTHRQIMFVNYLPFMILALISIDCMSEKKSHSPLVPHLGLTLSLFMILLHSYYFFPACFAACTLYFFYETRRRDDFSKNAARIPLKEKLPIWIHYLISLSASVGLAMILLLPTGLTILENKKDVKGSSLLEILAVNPTLNSLLYSAYGCGLTILCLYTLFLSIRRKKTRAFALILFCFLFFDIFYWILNGTLYVRPKSLIPFVPLILYLAAVTLEELWQNKINHSLGLALLCLVPVVIQSVFCPSALTTLTFADVSILICYAAFGTVRQRGINTADPHGLSYLPYLSLAVLCIVPSLLYLTMAGTEKFETKSNHSRNIFSQEEVEAVCKDKNARMDILEQPLTNTNYVYNGTQKKSTLYSSVSNTNYNKLFYDILKMPVNIRNRVAMNGDANPFQEYLMGVRYVQTSPEKLPAGYEICALKDGQVLAENDGVLPMAYGTSALTDEKYFDTLTYPQTLDTLTNRTIVPENAFSGKDSENSSQETAPYKSRMKSYSLPADFLNRSSTTEEISLTKTLPKPLKDTILLLSFDVRHRGQSDVSITINKIRNCLSGSSAPYPNHNTTFTYMLSSNEALEKLVY
ncbi:MAG: YfhO family protein [Eubacteriales bacterium]|nr:YfhO family protein [Eubacteriales bacterium]